MFVCQFALCAGEMRARVPVLSLAPHVCLSARRNVCAPLFFVFVCVCVFFSFLFSFSGWGGAVVMLPLVCIQI